MKSLIKDEDRFISTCCPICGEPAVVDRENGDVVCCTKPSCPSQFCESDLGYGAMPKAAYVRMRNSAPQMYIELKKLLQKKRRTKAIKKLLAYIDTGRWDC